MTEKAIENSQKPHSTPREYTLHTLQQNEVTNQVVFCELYVRFVMINWHLAKNTTL